jgi:hypothetical protein
VPDRLHPRDDDAPPHAVRGVLFDHVPKTGGMSLHAVLQAIVGVERCSPILTGSLDDARHEFARYRCVSGHFYFQPQSSLDGLWSLTVLRDPVERVLSHLAYERYDVPASGSASGQRVRVVDTAADLDAALDAADPQMLALVSNTMVAHFAPLAWDGREPLADDARRLALAKEALRRFDLVGLTERMEETVDLVCLALGGPPVPLPRLNVGSRRLVARDLPSATLARLRALNELDGELYANARELYHAARRQALFARPAVSATGPHVSASGAATAHVAAGPDPAVAAAPAAPAPRNFGSREAEILRIDAWGLGGLGTNVLAGEAVSLRIAFRARDTLDDLTVGLSIHDDRGRLVYGTNTFRHGHTLTIGAGGEGAVTFTFRAALGVGHYVVGASLHPGHSHLPTCFHWADALAFFDVVGNIGWDFEGATKLEPALEIEGAERRAVDPGVARPGLQVLAQLAPPVRDFRAAIEVPDPPSSIAAAQRVALRVDIANLGADPWPSLGERSVRVSYHWVDENGRVAVQDGERTHLPHDVAPGKRVSTWATIVAPATPGRCRLQLSLVQESIAWLEQVGGKPCELAVTITG